MKRPYSLLLAAVFWLAACQPAATPAPTQPRPAEQGPAAAKPTEAPAAAAQPARVTSIPLPTQQPKLNPPRSGGVLNSPTMVPTPGNNPANIDPTVTANWTTQQDQTTGLAFHYPGDWALHAEASTQPLQRLTLGPAGQAGTNKAALVIEVWKKPGDLLAWLRTQLPSGQLRLDSNSLEGGPTSYQHLNARLANLPAVFLYQPAKSSTADRAALFTADDHYIYQFTYLGDIPDDPVKRAIYLQVLNTVIISGSTTSGLLLPATTFTLSVSVNK